MTQTVIFRGSLLYSYTAQKQVEDFTVRDILEIMGRQGQNIMRLREKVSIYSVK